MTRPAIILASILLGTWAAPETAAQSQGFQWADAIELRFVDEYHFQWNDSGSGAGRSAGFFNPKPPEGFHIVGSIGRHQYGPPGAGTVSVVVRDISKDGSALAEPVGYRLVWSDKGSGAEHCGSFWKALPPKGYVAMGLYCQKGYAKPHTDAMRCVRRDLVEFGTPGAIVWNDSGSGVSGDFSAWWIDPPTATAGLAYLSANTFVGHNSYRKLGTDAETYVFKMSVEEQHEEETPPHPVLHGTARPSPYASDTTVDSRITLPWFAVHDPHMSAARRIKESPEYTLIRQDRYKLVFHSYNNSNSEQQPSVSFTEGFSETDTKSFSNTTGVSVTGGFNVKGVKMSVTLSHSFTYGHSTSRTNQFTRQVSYPLTVKAGEAAAVYSIESTFKLLRADNSVVGKPLVGTAPATAFYTSWPQTADIAAPGK